MNETKVPGSDPSDVTYQTMPHSGNSSLPPMPASPSSGGGSKAVYIIIGIIVLAIMGCVAYYFLGVKGNGNQSSQQNGNSKLSSGFLQQYFAKDVCDDAATCGDDADPDKDGLSNYQEFINGTNPIVADTDGDGLADGDEVNVYGTSPKNKFTDTRAIAAQNGFDDGVSIKNGYDPTTPGVKFTGTKLKTINDKIAQFQLHAPTTTTLGLNADGTMATPSSNTSVNPESGQAPTPTPAPSGTPDTTK